MKQIQSNKSLMFIMLVLIFSLAVAGTVMAGNGGQKSTSPVFWVWELENGITDNPVGESTLIRHKNRLNANYKTGGMTKGNAVTLWFIVFNYPELCAAGPFACTPADLGFDAPAQGDFMYAAGHVMGNGHFGGHLKVGDNSRSGLAELLGCEDCTPGLINPDGALVLLATHDHGPAGKGQMLKSQISTYTGGCDVYLGDAAGFARGFGDFPDSAGECSTLQLSPHAP